MKKLFTAAMIAVFALGAMTFTACEGYDDSELRRELEDLQKQLDDQKNRIAALEALTESLGDRIDDGAAITSITALPDGAGWRITFTKGDPIEIRHGAKGDKGDKGDTGDKGNPGDTRIADIVDNGDGTVTIDLVGGGSFTFTKYTDPDADPDYFGTWEHEDDLFSYRITIKADKLVYLDSTGDGYTLENLTWTAYDEPTDNTIYPTGYKLAGKLTDATNFIDLLPKDDGSGYAAIGDKAAVWWYIRASDKGALMEGNWEGGHAAVGYPFVKQP